MRIGTKFSLLVAGILTLTLGLTSLYTILDERQQARAKLRAQTSAQGQLLALIAPDAIIGYNFILLNDYVEQLTGHEDVRFAAVFDLRGLPITSYLDRRDPLVAQVLARHPGAGVREVSEALARESGLFVDRMPIATGNRLLGELVIATDLQRVDRELMLFTLRQTSAYLLIIALLTVAIVAVFRFNVVRPIRALVHGAGRVGRGNYEQPVEVYARDELGTLTTAFNGMMNQIKDEREQLYVQANFDVLTGLPNRKMAMDRIQHEIERARREGIGFAILFIDLDNFKYVNDTMGHATGDKLLVEVGLRFREEVRAIDLLARLGGDEYLVMMPHSTAPEAVHAAAERLAQAVARPVQIEDSDVYIKCSIGAAFFPEDGDTAERLMAAADSAMYSAKHTAGSSVQFYTKAMNEAARRRVEFERDIYTALEREEFFLAFQPVVRVADLSYVGAEALIRWKHPQKGLLSPNEFIPIAEQTGQIEAIGDWVLEQACRSASTLGDMRAAKGFISVNVSCNQLRVGFDKRVESVVRRQPLHGHRIVVEITETALMGDNPLLAEIFTALRRSNVKVSLDDFGTGFSSLSYLSRFNFDTIKIDKSFVDGLPDNRQARSVVAAIIAIANNLGMESIAEGVETEEQREALLELGCDYFQGYLHRRPLPLDEFRDYLRSAGRPAERKFG